MSDEERFGPVFESWLRDTDVPAPDAEPGIRRVAARLPETAQLRRRRWLPSFARARGSVPTSEETTDYHSSPIPATYAHTPTVIGRTTSMFSPAKAITAGAIIFALGGAFLIAQPFDQQGASVPGAATDAEAAPNAEFTAEWGFTSGGCCIVVEPASDPRFAGAMSASISHAYYPFPDSLLDVASRALHVVNDEGAWRGVPSVVVFHPDGTESTTTQTFIGEGDYAGLFAVADIKSTPGTGGGVELHGYILEGEPPAIE